MTDFGQKWLKWPLRNNFMVSVVFDRPRFKYCSVMQKWTLFIRIFLSKLRIFYENSRKLKKIYIYTSINSHHNVTRHVVSRYPYHTVSLYIIIILNIGSRSLLSGQLYVFSNMIISKIFLKTLFLQWKLLNDKRTELKSGMTF